jgi:hypothetical protein
VQQIGGLLDAVKLQSGSTSRLIANIPSQYIPLVSLQRWVTRIIDPEVKMTDRDLDVTSILEQFAAGNPALSHLVKPKTSFGKPITDKLNLVNAISPFKMSKDMRNDPGRKRRLESLLSK